VPTQKSPPRGDVDVPLSGSAFDLELHLDAFRLWLPVAGRPGRHHWITVNTDRGDYRDRTSFELPDRRVSKFLEGWPPLPASALNMNVLLIVIPLMVLGVLIATLPVLVGSFRHNRAMRAGRIETAETARQEADFWHRVLGHRRDGRSVATPELLSDEEVERVGASREEHLTADGESVWTSPS
jgi:hypothetical protein